MKTTDLPATHDVPRAWAKTHDIDPARQCVICARPVAAEKGYDLHFVYGGTDALRADLKPEDVGEDGGGDMGVWVIGPECAKTVPAAYRRARA